MGTVLCIYYSVQIYKLISRSSGKNAVFCSTQNVFSKRINSISGNLSHPYSRKKTKKSKT